MEQTSHLKNSSSMKHARWCVASYSWLAGLLICVLLCSTPIPLLAEATATTTPEIDPDTPTPPDTRAVNVNIRSPLVDSRVGVSAQGSIGSETDLQILKLLQELRDKEFVQDPNAYQARLKAITETTSTLLKEMNENPGHIVNLELYLHNANVSVIGQISEELNDGAMCEEFKQEVIVAVLKKFQYENETTIGNQGSCDLDTGEDSEGLSALERIFAVSRNIENSTPGAYLATQQRVNEQLQEREENLLRQADWGSGYIGVINCGDKSDPPPPIGGIRDRCTVTTPGSIVSQQVAKILQTPLDTLINADEIDEVQSELFTKLATQPLVSEYGLLGLGGNSSFVDPTSYSNQIRNLGELDLDFLSFLDSLEFESWSEGFTTSNRILREALTNTRAIRERQQEIVQAINEAEADFRDDRRPYANNSCWRLAFDPELVALREDLREKTILATATIRALEELVLAYETAIKQGASVDPISDEFLKIVASGLVGDNSLLADLQKLLTETVRPAITDMQQDQQQEISLCLTS